MKFISVALWRSKKNSYLIKKLKAMKRATFFAVLNLLCFLPAHSQLIKIPNPLKPIEKLVKAGVDAAIEIAKAPTTTVIESVKVVTGAATPSDILNPIKEIAQSSGSTIQAAADAINDPAKSMYTTVQNLAQKLPGGGIIFDLAIASTKFYTDLGYTSAVTLGNTLKGQNPLVLTAAPLAAAIYAARDAYAGSAKDLPEDVKRGLKDVFPENILQKAKWVVGKVEITLPNFIGQGAKFMGDHYAVVVDNIIVFNKTPPSYKEAATWWAHEITHVQQYNDLTIEVFAYKYLKDFGKSLETEANEKGSKANVDESNPVKKYTLLTQIYKDVVPQALNESVITKCVFDDDTTAVTYLVTSKLRILAVNPITTEYIHVGYAKTPKYANTKWRFLTPYLDCSITTNGEIIQFIKVPNPSGVGTSIRTIKRGHVEVLQESCPK